MIITMEHMRAVAFCASGVAQFFLRHHLDYDDFLANGIEEEKLLSTNSALARRVVAVAHKGEHHG